MLKLLVVCSVVVLPFVCGCATIVNGTTDTIQVSLNYNLPQGIEPADVNVTIAGQNVPPGGGTLIVERSSAGLPVQGRCSKPGYIVNTSPSRIRPSFAVGWFIWELFLPPGLLGIIVDFATGGYWNYPEILPISVTASPVRSVRP